jgi:hypothetical protein
MAAVKRFWDARETGIDLLRDVALQATDGLSF